MLAEEWITPFGFRSGMGIWPDHPLLSNDGKAMPSTTGREWRGFAMRAPARPNREDHTDVGDVVDVEVGEQDPAALLVLRLRHRGVEAVVLDGGGCKDRADGVGAGHHPCARIPQRRKDSNSATTNRGTA